MLVRGNIRLTVRTIERAPSPLPGTAPRYRLGIAFSSPSLIVFVAVFDFAIGAVFQTLQKVAICFRASFHNFECSDKLWDVFWMDHGWLISDPFQTTRPFFTAPMFHKFRAKTFSVRCPRCQEQRSDTSQQQFFHG